MVRGKAMGAWALAPEAVSATAPAPWTGILAVSSCLAYAKSTMTLAPVRERKLTGHRPRAFRLSEYLKVSATLAREWLRDRLQTVWALRFLRHLTLAPALPLPPLPRVPPLLHLALQPLPLPLLLRVSPLPSPYPKGIHQSVARHLHRLRPQPLLPLPPRPLPRLRVGRQRTMRSMRISC